MQKFLPPIYGIDQLFAEHQRAVLDNAPWPSILQDFYDNDWFNHLLQKVVRLTLRKRNLPIALFDDLQQEAWLVLANSLKKSPISSRVFCWY